MVAGRTVKKLPKLLYCEGIKEHNEFTWREIRTTQSTQLRTKLRNSVIFIHVASAVSCMFTVTFSSLFMSEISHIS